MSHQRSPPNGTMFMISRSAIYSLHESFDRFLEIYGYKENYTLLLNASTFQLQPAVMNSEVSPNELKK